MSRPPDKVLRAAKGADKALISDVSLFDVYAGDRIEAGKKSLAIEVTLQPRDAPDRRRDRSGVSENRGRGGESRQAACCAPDRTVFRGMAPTGLASCKQPR
jgi:ferredoxin-fold anticodon binding domain-containing protein